MHPVGSIWRESDFLLLLPLLLLPLLLLPLLPLLLLSVCLSVCLSLSPLNFFAPFFPPFFFWVDSVYLMSSRLNIMHQLSITCFFFFFPSFFPLHFDQNFHNKLLLSSQLSNVIHYCLFRLFFGKVIRVSSHRDLPPHPDTPTPIPTPTPTLTPRHKSDPVLSPCVHRYHDAIQHDVVVPDSNSGVKVDFRLRRSARYQHIIGWNWLTLHSVSLFDFLHTDSACFNAWLTCT